MVSVMLPFSATGTIRIFHPNEPLSLEHSSYISASRLDWLQLKSVLYQLSEVTLRGTSGTHFRFLEAQLNYYWSNTKKPSVLPAPIYLYGICSSSIDVAINLYKENLLPVWGSVLVSSQFMGRGQLRRTWISPSGNLYATIRLPQSELFSSTAAAPAIGTLFTHVLNCMGIPISLKWPNDLILFKNNSWEKVGGILLEEREGILFAGIGINIHTSPERTLLRMDASLPAGNISLPQCISSNSSSNTTRILKLWTYLVNNVFLCYKKHYYTNSSWLQLAERYLGFKGEYVVLKDGIHENQSYQGILNGLSNNGGICLSIHGKQKIFLSGTLYPLLSPTI